MTDGESIDLQYFDKDNLPNHIKKRAKALIESLGEGIWDLEDSFLEL
ncbi:hypothetical protein [Halalkalibacter suaedae]